MTLMFSMPFDRASSLPAPAVPVEVDPIRIDLERAKDAPARERLLDRAFGPARFTKTCERLRAGRLPARGLSLVASADGVLVGTIRLWHVEAGSVPALMLGPLAVDVDWRRFGIGARLMDAALDRAAALGHGAILLVGDAPYYARFGFSRAPTMALDMPGPVEADRFLGRELAPGGFVGAKGMVRPTGALDLGRRGVPRTRLARAA